MRQPGEVEPFEHAATSGPPPAGAFQPYVPATEAGLAEMTPRAVLLGIFFGVLFGASSVYLALKVGLTVSASIPIAVLSIVILKAFRGTILENNMVQTVGSAGESIAAGSVFVIPAIVLLGYDLDFLRTTLIALTGGMLGVLLMIPLRRALIVNEHGRLKYPEGTACAEVLVAGETRGAQARLIVQGGLLGFAYKFLSSALRLWNDTPEKVLGWLRGASISGELSPELLGVGYIIGYRGSAIIMAGGAMSYLVLIPAIAIFGAGLPEPFHATKLIRDMSPVEIRGSYVLYIGAGAVATGGLINLLRALPTIAGAFREGLRGFRGGAAAGARAARTERDLSMRVVLLGALAIVLAIWAIPYFEMTWYGALLIVLFGFFFATVSSRIVGEIGSSNNPVSGMTVAALLGTSLFFLMGGKTGIAERVVAISVGAVVCIVAANAGATSQDLKTGFLVGATPRRQQLGILIGAATSALMVGATLILMNQARTVEIPVATVEAARAFRDVTIRERPSETAVSRTDGRTYRVLRVLEHEAALPKGKYLVDEGGRIAYLVDAGIGGTQLEARRELGKDRPFDAPKPTLMAYIVDGILQRRLPWAFVLLGVFTAVVLELAGVSSLPFAVGLYLPISTSTPIFAGGLVRLAADRLRVRRGGRLDEGDAGGGVLMSSGLIAGGALCGILIAILGIVTWQGAPLARALDLSSRAGAFGESPLVSVALFSALALALARVAFRKDSA